MRSTVTTVITFVYEIKMFNLIKSNLVQDSMRIGKFV